MYYHVYALYNKNCAKIYIGQTQNLDERIDLHRKKIFENSYTAKLPGEWILIYREKVNNRKDALKREKQLKSYQGRQFIKSLIPTNL